MFELPVLNLPAIRPRLRKNETQVLQIFDAVRKKFVDLTPEEWVRQHVIYYLTTEKQVPASFIAVERQLLLNGTKRRTDLVIFNPVLIPLLIVECKAPSIAINQLTIDQALRYHLILQVPYVFLSNGLQHVCLKMENNGPVILKALPDYTEMLNSN